MRDKKTATDLYIESKIRDESEHLKEIRKNAFQDNRIFMQLGKLECKILQMCIKMHLVKKVVEVGTLAGYSAIWMSGAISSSGIVYTIEKNEEHAKIAQQNFEKYKNIRLIHGDAKICLNQIKQDGPFDMMFIDADKSAYPNYLDWAEANIKKGGLIVADNTLLFGTIACSLNKSKSSWVAMNEFNERLSDKFKYDSVILPTKDGLTIAIKKF